MPYVLLKLSEEAARKFVPKADKKVLGVWESFDEYCGCSKESKAKAEDWFWDQLSGRHLHKDCELPGKPVTTLRERLRMAFIGDNVKKLYR